MADLKISDLTAMTALGGDELLYVVDDPTGTPLDRKITMANVAASVVLAPDVYANRPAATTVPLGALYFATDTREWYRSTGSAWTTLTQGVLLGRTVYEPATLATYSTTSSTDADMDATNLSVSFTVPASGAVIGSLTALANCSATDTDLRWGVRNGSTNVTGSQGRVFGLSTATLRMVHRFLVTGLTAGTATTWKWSHARELGSNTCNTFMGDTTAHNGGPGLMEVWSA